MNLRRFADDDRGAEVIEFALVFPVLIFLIFALVYGLLAVAANASLAHAASRGVRYASIPVDPVYDTYRTEDEVADYVADQAPMFAKSSCDTTVSGDQTSNAPVTLVVTCDFPNPMGKALSALRTILTGNDNPDAYSDSLEMSARAEARRE